MGNDVLFSVKELEIMMLDILTEYGTDANAITFVRALREMMHSKEEEENNG